jgi:ABC-2 type transport system permease protein
VSAVGLAWQQFRLERKLFWRNPSAAFFNFILPLVLLLLVASVFAGEQDELDVLIPGIAGMSVMASTFNALVFNVTFLREEGILKRVRGTPMPTASYLAGLIGSAVANAFVTVALVVVIGNLIYDVEWPREPVALVGFTALGVVCFAALGIAFSHAIPNADSVPAYQNAVFLPLIFISGVFYSAEDLPPALEAVAEALPLKHLIDGLSAAITGAAVNEAAAAAVVGAWAAAGVFLAVRFFRWE